MNLKNSGNKKKIDPIPEHFKSIEEASDFWDNHSIADYWDQTKEAHFEIEIEEEPRYFAIESKIAKKIDELARFKGISSETLVNLWLQEKVSEV